MSEGSELAALSGWIQTGGVLAFAGAVLWELKQLRPLFKAMIEERQKDRETMTEVKVVLSSLLERERMRAEQRAQLIELRRRGDSDRPVSRRPQENYDDTTDAVAMPLQPIKKRHRSNPGGHPIGGYGPIKPPRDDSDED